MCQRKKHQEPLRGIVYLLYFIGNIMVKNSKNNNYDDGTNMQCIIAGVWRREKQPQKSRLTSEVPGNFGIVELLSDKL